MPGRHLRAESRACWLPIPLLWLAVAVAAQNRFPAHRPPPDPILPQVEAAAARINRGKRAEGIRDLQAILEKHPAHRQALEALAQVLLQDRRNSEAAHLLARCIKKHPGSSRCRTFQGQLRLARGDVSGAASILEKAVQANSADPEAHLHLGLVLIRQNQLDRAEIELNHALAYRKPGSLTVVHLHLAGLYDRQNRPFQAAQQLEWYLRENPEAANAAQLRSRIAQLRSAAPPQP